MIEFLAEYGMFFAKVATFVVAALLVIGFSISASQRGGSTKEGHLEIKKINRKFEAMEQAINEAVLSEHELKEHKKALKKKVKEEKKGKKDSKAGDESKPKNVYVLDFDGDMKASAVECLREEITAILSVAGSDDEVVLRLESPGGMVHAYGLAASQVLRIRSAGIPLTICVDKVAASGGYMMACTANKIVAAPFAVIGSIGVVASLPNFNRVLKKHDIDYELYTAGEYKRTVTMLGENTREGRKKFVSELEDTHGLFQDFVSRNRPSLDIESVATGETWYGQRALERQLVDELMTSDQYLTAIAKDNQVYEVTYEHKKNWQEKLGVSVESALENSLLKLISQALSSWNTRH